MCEVSTNSCGTQNFKELIVQDYIDRVLKDKPDYLKYDNFQDALYEDIAA